MKTIRLGSTGTDVTRLQVFLGIPATGSFDSTVKQAVIDYQTKEGLVADGIVGPATWAHIEGKKIEPGVMTPSASIDGWAYQIAKNADPTMPEAYRRYALTVAKGEGHFGQGWANPSSKTLQDSQQFGVTGYEGKGSNNWGAVQGSASAGSFPHVDYHADGRPYLGHFKKYATPEEGFLDMARILLKPNVKSALDKGSVKDAVYAQHDNGYFELNPTKYLAAVERNYQTLASNLNWKSLGKGGSVGLAILGLVAIGYGVYRMFTDRA